MGVFVNNKQISGRVIVLGLGNTSFADDGAGIMVARSLKNRISERNITVSEACISGLDILENIAGYKKAIIIDAVQTGHGTPGAVYHLSHDQLCSSTEFTPHGIDVLTAIALGKKLGMDIPDDIVVFGVEAQDITTLREECTAEVKNAIPVCADMVIRELETTDIMGQYVVKKPEGDIYAE